MSKSLGKCDDLSFLCMSVDVSTLSCPSSQPRKSDFTLGQVFDCHNLVE